MRNPQVQDVNTLRDLEQGGSVTTQDKTKAQRLVATGAVSRVDIGDGYYHYDITSKGREILAQAQTSTRDHYPRLTVLARSFPALERAKGLAPFDPEEFDRWAAQHTSGGGRHAARFVLAVWSGTTGTVFGRPRKGPDDCLHFTVETWWRVGLFDVVDAMARWDDPHRQAFLAWAKDPWWG